MTFIEKLVTGTIALIVLSLVIGLATTNQSGNVLLNRVAVPVEQNKYEMVADVNNLTQSIQIYRVYINGIPYLINSAGGIICEGFANK